MMFILSDSISLCRNDLERYVYCYHLSLLIPSYVALSFSCNLPVISLAILSDPLSCV